MANFVAQWVASDTTMGAQSLMTAYAPGSNPNLAAGTEPSAMSLRGFDPSLGIGQFVYAQASAAAGVTAGNICEITQTLLTGTVTWGSYSFNFGASVQVLTSVQQWAGTVNTGRPLCVAVATLAQFQFGWFQIYGNALVTSSGAIAAGNSAYWQAAGVVQAGAVASKQMVNAQAVVANSANFGQAVSGVVPTLTATQSIYFIAQPSAQDAIT